MSLEQIIKDNTAALVANTAAIAALLTVAPASATSPDAAPKTPPANPVTPPPAAGALTYDVVAKVVSDFVKANGRAPAVILLEPLKVTTITGFKEKPAELAQIHAIFTDPAKIAAAKARAASEAAAAAAAAAKPA